MLAPFVIANGQCVAIGFPDSEGRSCDSDEIFTGDPKWSLENTEAAC